jgi:hypothetical protein
VAELREKLRINEQR